MQDNEIIELYWSRDEAAISRTQEKYGSYCYTVAMRVLKRAEDAEECLNDSYLSLWNSIPPKRPENLLAYLAATVRNRAIDLLRSMKRRGQSEYTLSLDEITEVGQVDEELDAQELGAILSRFLETEKDSDRRVFVSRYYLFMPVNDIAKKYGLKVGTVKSTLHRMRQRLKDYLESEGVSV